MGEYLRAQTLAALVVLGVVCGAVTPVAGQDTPTRIVLFVVDGAGIGMWSIANYENDDSAMRQFPVVGLMDTRSVRGFYPGSADAATSFATGTRTFNGAIGVGPDSQPRETVLELAAERGLATGLVTTARITDATPAAFSAHTPTRPDEAGIALQQAEHDITVFLGGGRQHFHPSGRPDSLDIIDRFRQLHTYVETGAELEAADTDTVTSLYGLFTWSDMPVFPDRNPSLAAMTSAALEVLHKDPDGFFLLLETESTDTEPHGNVEYSVLAGEMVDVEATAKVVLEYQQYNPETLILMLGDHDTGGLAIQQVAARRQMTGVAAQLDTNVVRLGESAVLMGNAESALLDSTKSLMNRTATTLRRRAREITRETILVARYTTGSHTANLVPLFAKGPGAERFGGVIDNYRIGEILLDMVRR